MSLEGSAARSSSLAVVLSLFRHLAEAWALAASQRCSAGEGADEKRKKKAPTAAILDSQTVKMADQPGTRGYDAGKKVAGRKRHLLVDTLGLILVVVVHAANIQDRDGAKTVIDKARPFGWLRVIFADGGYTGALVAWVRETFRGQGTRLEIVPKLGCGFRVLAKRWIVERTFSWFNHYRRLSKDYEVKPAHSEAFIYAAATRLMLRRLAPKPV
jgi:putative transposase